MRLNTTKKKSKPLLLVKKEFRLNTLCLHMLVLEWQFGTHRVKYPDILFLFTKFPTSAAVAVAVKRLQSLFV